MEKETQPELIPFQTDRGILHQLFLDGVMVLTEPVRFFRERFEELSFNQALAFGLVVSWLSAFLGWLTRALKHESLMDGLIRIKKQLQQLPVWKDLPEDIWAQGSQIHSIFPEWAIEGMRVLVDPFYSLFGFVLYGLIFWIGASLIIPGSHPLKKSASLARIIKITAISSTSGMVGSILGFLPLSLGPFIGWIYHTILLMIGFSERFEISRLRSLVILFLPMIALILIASCLLGLVVAILGGLVASIFQ